MTKRIFEKEDGEILEVVCECGRHFVIAPGYTCEEKDPYLQPGWPCEIWSNCDGLYFLAYATTEKGRFAPKRSELIAVGYRYSDSYRPIGTEWDFIPDYVDEIVLGKGGVLSYNDCLYPRDIKTVLPPQYYGQTIRRPEWAK